MGTFFVTLILLFIIFLIIFSLVKAKRNGRHPSCGGNCASCAGACNCHSEKRNSYETKFQSVDKPIKL